jgi:two-component sensor histidine kinase
VRRSEIWRKTVPWPILPNFSVFPSIWLSFIPIFDFKILKAMRLNLLIFFVFYSCFVCGQNQVDSLKRLIAASKSDSNRVNWMLQLETLAMRPYQRSKIDGIILNILAAKKLADAIHFEAGSMEASENLAYVYMLKLRVDSALTIYQNLLPEAEKAGNKSLIAKIQSGIGIGLGKKGESQLARVWLHKAIDNAKSLKDEQIELGCLRAISVSYFVEEKFAEAIDTITLTYDRYKAKNDHLNAAQMSLLVCEYYRSIEMFNDALLWIDISKNHAILAKDTLGLVNGFMNQATIYQNLEKWDSSEICLNEILKIGEYWVDLGSQQSIYYLLANLSSKKNDLASEGKWLKKYGDLHAASGSKGFLPHAIDFEVSFGFYNLKTNNMKAAQEHFFIALDLAETWQSWNTKASIYDGLSQLAEKQGNAQKALKYFKLYAAARDSFYNEEKTRKLTQVEMSYQFSKKQATQKAAQSLELAQRDSKSLQQKWLFGSLILGLLSIGGFLFYNFRQRAQQEQIRLELANLRSQMNPHFIFNCLNSIYKHTQTGDSLTAGIYLQKFSKLLRLVLENSQLERIALKKDLDALVLYAEIEGLRFKEKLNFELKVDPNIDTDFVKIPGMLLQPHVENAIWHGLMHRENGGKVTVNITQPNEQLLHVVIEDNGVGRMVAAELDSKTATSHKSLGREITENRLKMSGKQSKMETKMETIDLFDQDQNPCGTRVILEIPV